MESRVLFMRKYQFFGGRHSRPPYGFSLAVAAGAEQKDDERDDDDPSARAVVIENITKTVVHK